MKTKIQRIVDCTNASLIGWYQLAQEDYGIIGSAVTSYNEEEQAIEIRTIENGHKLPLFSQKYFEDQPIGWVFDLWCEFYYID